ncbi:MAG: hypothetical protein EZS28_013844 [Streblomastix strix]|uniref:Uncharacterized protein n=1 Tax=Streblomastix strix TaxID=222440 RepID=A0A5J4W6R5_9EUKA|nr:MAG: hypothetical protein EZS28_013844 [Streblomastix strix]
MDLQHALKNLIENGTNIEYFDNGYVIQINKDIKVFEKRKMTLKKLTQTQQNKLLLQARGGAEPQVIICDGAKTKGSFINASNFVCRRSVVDYCFLQGLFDIYDEDLMGIVLNHVFSNQGAITVCLARAE